MDSSEHLDSDSQPPEPDASVSMHETSPGQVVFTEVGNADGWIATDLTVTVELSR